MRGEPDLELEDRLRIRLRELDGVPLTPYAVVRERAGRRRSSPRAFAVVAAAVVLIIFGILAGERLRGAEPPNAASGVAATGDCGARTSQRDATGHLVGVSKDTTTILVLPLSVARPEVDTWFDWYMTGIALLAVHAEDSTGSRIEPNLIMPTGSDRFLVRIAFPKPGCWRLHAERAGGQLSGDIWLDVWANGATPSLDYAKADCSTTSWRDATGRLIGTTADSTAILVSTPAEIRPNTEVTLDWSMTSGGLRSPFTVYAQYGDGTRITPRSIETVGPDDFRVQLVFPKPGCWRLHSERINGKLSGDVWVQVLPGR